MYPVNSLIGLVRHCKNSHVLGAGLAHFCCQVLRLPPLTATCRQQPPPTVCVVLCCAVLCSAVFSWCAPQGRYVHEATQRIPIIGDGDTGYGNAMNIKRTVRGYAAAGFAGTIGRQAGRQARLLHRHNPHQGQSKYDSQLQPVLAPLLC